MTNSLRRSLRVRHEDRSNMENPVSGELPTRQPLKRPNILPREDQPSQPLAAPVSKPLDENTAASIAEEEALQTLNEIVQNAAPVAKELKTGPNVAAAEEATNAIDSPSTATKEESHSSEDTPKVLSHPGRDSPSTMTNEDKEEKAASTVNVFASLSQQINKPSNDDIANAGEEDSGSIELSAYQKRVSEMYIDEDSPHTTTKEDSLISSEIFKALSQPGRTTGSDNSTTDQLISSRESTAAALLNSIQVSEEADAPESKPNGSSDDHLEQKGIPSVGASLLNSIHASVDKHAYAPDTHSEVEANEGEKAETAQLAANLIASVLLTEDSSKQQDAKNMMNAIKSE